MIARSIAANSSCRRQCRSRALAGGWLRMPSAARQVRAPSLQFARLLGLRYGACNRHARNHADRKG